MGEAFPPMPLRDWRETKETIHRFWQVVGKVRLAEAPFRSHWWHVPLHLTGRGLTTRPMGSEVVHSIDLDLVDHRLEVASIDGNRTGFPLSGLSVAEFYRRLMEALDSIGVDPAIRAVPFDLADSTPFPEDRHHAAYDPEAVTRYWRILSRVAVILEAFAGRFDGKASPVHHFWHTLDLAYTRFSDREVELPADTDPVTREAYRNEVISFGFWFGDDDVPSPAFYSYTAPEPEGLADRPLQPDGASWAENRGGHLAVYPYDAARATGDVPAAALAFYESAYRAGAELAGWDIDRLSTG